MSLPISSDPVSFADLWSPIYANGWSSIPLLPLDAVDHEGEPLPGLGKRPLIHGWQAMAERQLDPIQLDTLARYGVRRIKSGGLGIACGWRGVVALDLDIEDEVLVERVHRIAARVLGPGAPCRIGRAPRKMLVYRLAEGEEVATYRPGYAGGHKIEFMSKGTQFAAYGIHPKTGKPYHWEGGVGPYNTRVDELPEITAADLAEFYAQAAEILGQPILAERRTKDGEPRRVWTAPAEGSSREIVERVNAAALEHIESWIHHLGLNFVHKVGREWRAQATYRSGSTRDSLKVSPLHGIHDFGAGVGYSATKLVQTCRDVRWLDAFGWLAERVGIPDAADVWKERRDAEDRASLAQPANDNDDDDAEEEEEPEEQLEPLFRATLRARPGNNKGAARADLRAGLETFFASADSYWSERDGLNEDAPQPAQPAPPVMGGRAREGLGKSTMTREILAERLGEGDVAVIVTPTLKLAEEAAARFEEVAGPGTAFVMKGQTAAGMCDQHDRASKISAAGGRPTTLCHGCEFAKSCAYKNQAKTVKDAEGLKVLFGSHATLGTVSPALAGLGDRRIRYLVVDESPSSALVEEVQSNIDGLIGFDRVPVSIALGRERLYLGTDHTSALMRRAASALHRKMKATAEVVAGRGYRDTRALPVDVELTTDEVRVALDVANQWVKITESALVRSAASVEREIAAKELEHTASGDVFTLARVFFLEQTIEARKASDEALERDLRTASRLRSLLAALAAARAKGEREVNSVSVTSRDGVVAYRQRRRVELAEVYASTPMLVTDASLLPEPQMRAVFPGFVQIFDVDVIDGPGVTRIAVTGTPGTRNSLANPGTVEKIGRAVTLLNILSGKDAASRLLVAPKSAAAKITTDESKLTFGSTRGVDAFAGAGVVTVVGNNTPGVREAEGQAAALLGRQVHRITVTADGGAPWYTEKTVAEGTTVDGRPYKLTTVAHPDPGVDAVLSEIMSEGRQAAARGRPADIGPDRRQWIVNVGDHGWTGPLPDVVIDITALDLGRFGDGVALGVIAESSRIMGALAGWSDAEIANAKTNVSEALRLIKAGAADAIGAYPSSIDSMMADTPQSPDWYAITVQTPGRGRSTISRAWVLASSPAEAADRIRSALAEKGVELKRSEPITLSTGEPVTLAMVGDVLFTRRPTDDEVAAFTADETTTHAVQPVTARPLALSHQREHDVAPPLAPPRVRLVVDRPDLGRDLGLRRRLWVQNEGGDLAPWDREELFAVEPLPDEVA